MTNKPTWVLPMAAVQESRTLIVDPERLINSSPLLSLSGVAVAYRSGDDIPVAQFHSERSEYLLHDYCKHDVCDESPCESVYKRITV